MLPARIYSKPATRWQPELLTMQLAIFRFGTLELNVVLHIPVRHRIRAEPAVRMLNGRANWRTRMSSWSTLAYHWPSYIKHSLDHSCRVHFTHMPMLTVKFFSFRL